MFFISSDAWTCPNCGLTYVRRHDEPKSDWKARKRELQSMTCEGARR